MTLDPKLVDALSKLISAAVVCLSPSVAWATFYVTRRDRAQEVRAEKLGRIATLQQELTAIEQWAGREYTDAHHDRNWFSPYWHVSSLPSLAIESFSRTAAPEELGRPVWESLVALRASIRRFRGLLKEHFDYQSDLDRRDEHARTRIEHAFQQGGDPPMVQGDSDRELMHEIYHRLRRIHVEGIGTDADKRRLFHTRRIAEERLQAAREAVLKSRRSWVFLAGHRLAVLLGVFGIGFIVLFVMVAGGWAKMGM